MHTRTMERIAPGLAMPVLHEHGLTARAIDNAPAGTSDDVTIESRGEVVARLHSLTHALRMVRALTMKGEPWRLADACGLTLASS